MAALDRVRVASLCAELVDHLSARSDPYPEHDARCHLKTLRGNRFFDHVVQLADRFLRKSPGAGWIRRDLAQAHLDRSQVVTAVAVLHSLLAGADVPATIRCEAVGLLGRAYKQIYVDSKSNDARDRAALRESIDRYYEIYSSDRAENLWHGINVVSLLCRAERDGIAGFDQLPKAQELAREILAVLDRRERERDDPLSPWDLATAAEAWIALGDYVAAGKRLFEYAKNSAADAFALGSTHRQLTEVVQLDQRPTDARFLVDIVRGELLRRETGQFEATAGEVRERALQADPFEGLQQVFGDERYVVHGWLRTGFKRAAAVARVKKLGRTRGTGFVVPGLLLHAEWNHQVLLTNNHVMSQRPLNPILQIRPPEAEITFDGIDGAGSFRVQGAPLFESPIDELDVTIVRLDGSVGPIEPYRIAEELPAMGEPAPRMYVIGHPNGSELSYSLADNQLLGVNERRIHYRSPTDPGSSGSPVFDASWDLVAIHHSGERDMPSLVEPGKIYDANEGVPIRTIVRAIANKQ